MKNTKQKWIFSILIIAAFMIVYAVCHVFINTAATIKDELSADISKKTESIINTYEIVSDNTYSSIDSYEELYQNFVRITADLLKDTLSDDPGQNIRSCYDGYIIHVEDETVQAPSGIDVDFSEVITVFAADTYYFSTFDEENNMIFWYFSRIKDQYFFLRPFAENTLEDFVNVNTAEKEAYLSLETAFNLSYAIIRENPGKYEIDGNECYTIYATNGMADEPMFASCTTLDEYLALDHKSVGDSSLYTTKKYSNEDENLAIIIKTPLRNSISMLFESAGVGMACIFTFLLIFIIWIISAMEFVRDHHLTDEQKNRYRPAHIRRTAISYGIVSSIIIFAVVMFADASRNVQKYSEQCENALNSITYRVMMSADNKKISQEYANKIYGQYGKVIDSVLKDHPELIKREMLQTAANDINAGFITLYDSEGREIASSTELIGLQLGTSAEDMTSSFRKILNGVETVSVSDVDDPYYGKYRNVIGIRTDQDNDRYGVMLIGVKSENIIASQRGDSDHIIHAMTNSSDLAMVIEKTSMVIMDSTDDDLRYTLAEDAGIDENHLKNRMADFYSINNVRYYGLSDEYESNLYYYLIRCREMFGNLLPYSLMSVFWYAVVFAVLYHFLMRAYTDEDFEKYADTGEYMLRRNYRQYTPERMRREYQGDRKKNLFDGMRWSEQFPEQKALFVFRLIAGILILCLLFQIRDADNEASASIFNYLIYGNWTRGLNLFSFSAIVLLGILFAFAMMIIQLIFNLLFNTLGTKGITIAHLILNLIRYTLAFIYLYLVCQYLGFDPRAVVVSAGIVTFAVSFGAKDIIGDMLSGILVVFEGDFQVGDIIQVGDFRGTVLEIGVRSTKLIGNGNNIKSIPNQNVKNVLNLTRMNSWYTMEIKVPNDVPINDLEAMLNEELPKISKRIPEIINGPEYKGVINIGNGFMTILIIAEYDEDDYYRVQRKMNREIMILFNEKHIKVL